MTSSTAAGRRALIVEFWFAAGQDFLVVCRTGENAELLSWDLSEHELRSPHTFVDHADWFAAIFCLSVQCNCWLQIRSAHLNANAITALTSPTRGFHKTCHAQAKLHPFGGAFVYDAAWLSLNPQKLSLSVFVRRYMRSRAQIFSGSAYVISASTWSSVTTTPSMTRWSTLGTRNCFHAVLRQSTASCSRTTVRWQRAVKLNVSEKAFRFSTDAQGRCPASGLADAVRQPTASSAWRSSRLVFLLLNASATQMALHHRSEDVDATGPDHARQGQDQQWTGNQAGRRCASQGPGSENSCTTRKGPCLA